MTQHQPTRSKLIMGLGLAGAAVLVVPLIGLLLEAPWSSFFDLLNAPEARAALRVSLVVSVAAAVLSMILGVPLAFLLARVDLPAKSFLRAVVTVPLVLPPVVTGVALLSGFGRRGLLGKAFGFGLPFTTTGAVLAATVVSMPFLVLSVEGALRSADYRLEEMAGALGAGPLRRWWTVTLPMIRPAMIAGGVLAWARALGEFGATVTFAGSTPGVTQTLPLEVVVALNQASPGPERAQALSLLMMLIAVVVLFGLRDRWVPRR